MAEQKTTIEIGGNAQPLVNALAQGTAAAKQFETAIGSAANATTQSGAKITLTANQFARLVQSLDPAAKSAAQYAAAAAKVSTAMDAGRMGEGSAALAEQARLLDLAATKYKTVEFQARAAAQAQADAAAKEVEAQEAAYQSLTRSLNPAAQSAAQFADAQALITARLAAGKISQEEANAQLDQANVKYNTLANQARVAAEAQVAAATKAQAANKAEFDALESRLVPAIGAQKAFADTQKIVSEAVATGNATQAQATVVLDRARVAYGQTGNAVRLTGQQAYVVTAQFRQMFDQFASGSGIIRPAFQQLPVVIEELGGLGGTLKFLGQNIATIAGVGGFALLGGVFAAVSYSAERTARSINTISNSLQPFGGSYRQTAQLIESAAKELAGTTSMSTKDAVDAMTELAKTPGLNLTRENLLNLAKEAQDFSVAFGESMAAAGGRIRSALTEPVATAITEMKARTAGFTIDFVHDVQAMVAAGNAAGAGKAVNDLLAAAHKDAAKNVTDLQKALNDLTEALTRTGTAANGTAGGTTTLLDVLTKLIDGATHVVDGLNAIISVMSKIGVSVNTEATIFGLAFAQMLGPVRTLEAALLRVGKAAVIRVTTSVAAGAAEGVTAGAVGAATATAVGAGTAAATAGEVGVLAAVGGLAGVAVIVAAVLATAGAAIWIFYSNQSGQQSFKDKAETAGFQQYKAGFFEQPRYKNTSTGEDFSTEEMSLRLSGQKIAKSFATEVDEYFSTHMPSWLGGKGDALQQLAAQPTPGSKVLAPIPNYTGKYADLFAASEQKYGLPTGLLPGIASIETGGTFDPTLTNKESGAGGLMQILDSTANRPGYGITPIASADRYDPAKSIDFAGQMIANVAKSLGSLDAAIKLYSGGGYNLKSGVTAPPAAPTGPLVDHPIPVNQEIAQVLAGTSQASPENLTKGLTVGTEKLKEYTTNYIAYIETLKKGDGQTQVSAETLGALTKEQEHQRAALEALKTPIERNNEEQQRQLNVESELNPVQRQVIEATQQLEVANRAAGKGYLTVAEKAEAAAGVLKIYSAQLAGTVTSANLSASAQERIAGAWETSQKAAEHQTNAERARQQVVGNSPTVDAAQRAAIDQVTAALDRESAATEKATALQAKRQAVIAGESLNVEEANLSASAKEQAVAAAQQQYRASINKKLGDKLTPEQQAASNQIGLNAVRTVDVDREKAAWSAVDGAATSAIEDIGNGLETALSTGKWTDFASAAKQALSEISKMFLELALLNPLKNALTGGRANAPSLFDLFNGTGNANNPLANGGVLSGGQVSGGGSASGGFNAGGLLGSVGGLFSKTGFFGSEGTLFGPGGWFGSAAAGPLSTAAPDVIAANAAALDATAADFAATLPAASATDTLLMAGIYHTGGIVGETGGNIRGGLPLSAFAGAPRYHSGGIANDNLPSRFTDTTLPPQFSADEVPAVLRRNELVMTQAQQRAVAGRLSQANARQQPIIHQNFNISTPDANSFRASKSQLQTEMARAVVAASRKM